MCFRKPTDLVFRIPPQILLPGKLCDLLEIPLKVHSYFQLKLCWPCSRWCWESSSSQLSHTPLSLQCHPGYRAGKSPARWALQGDQGFGTLLWLSRGSSLVWRALVGSILLESEVPCPSKDCPRPEVRSLLACFLASWVCRIPLLLHWVAEYFLNFWIFFEFLDEPRFLFYIHLFL